MIALALGALSFGLAWGAAQPYPGVTVDSGEYLSVAEGLSSGHGYTMPYVSYDEPFRVLEEGERVQMTQFPPLYPTLLGGGHRVSDLRLLDIVRLLGSFAYLATILCAVFLVWRASASRFASATAGLLLLGPDLVSIHAVAWTEPFMNLPMLGTIAFLLRFLERRGKGDLVLAGVCAVVATLARFAGVAVVLGAAVVIFVEAGTARERLRTFLWLVCASLPAAAWFLGNTLGAGIASEKQLAWHLPKPSDLGRAVQTMGSWVVPSRIGGVVAGTVVIGIVVFLLMRRRGRRGSQRAALVPVARICLVMGSAYAGFLLVYRSFMDQNVSFDFRILSPLHLLAVVALCSSYGSLPKALPRWAMTVVLLVGLATLGRGVHAAITFTSSTTPGYTSDPWLDSELLQYAGEVGKDAEILTNTPDAIWLRHRLEPIFLPIASNLYTGEENTAYEIQLQSVRDRLGCRPAVVAFFTQPTRKRPRTIDQRVIDAFGLRRARALSDGVAYKVTPPERCP